MKRKMKWVLSFAVIILIVLTVWTLWGNTALEVNEFEIKSGRIPQNFDGFRIAQVSDITRSA